MIPDVPTSIGIPTGLGDDAALTRARLTLCRATRVVLANTLGLIGVVAPERM